MLGERVENVSGRDLGCGEPQLDRYVDLELEICTLVEDLGASDDGHGVEPRAAGYGGFSFFARNEDT